MVNWEQALLIFVLGIGTVFAVLIILWAVLAIMAKLAGNTSKKNEEISAPTKPNVAAANTTAKVELKMSTPKKVAKSAPENEDELLAIFTAAVAADANSSNIRIKSYKKM